MTIRELQVVTDGQPPVTQGFLYLRNDQLSFDSLLTESRADIVDNVNNIKSVPLAEHISADEWLTMATNNQVN